MFWQTVWPAEWQKSTAQQQFLHRPEDLDALVPLDSVQRLRTVAFPFRANCCTGVGAFASMSRLPLPLI